MPNFCYFPQNANPSLLDKNGNIVYKNFEDKLIENETGSELKPFDNGKYSVIAVGNEGCESDYSDDYLFSNSSVIYDENDFIKIFPNPNSGEFTIKDEAIKNIEIFDLLGHEIEFEMNHTAKFIEISILEPSKGVYTLLISTGDKLYTKKIIIY
jgi:hypothetical protein